MPIGIEQDTKSIIFFFENRSITNFNIISLYIILVFNYKSNNMIINSVDSIKNVLGIFFFYKLSFSFNKPFTICSI